MSIVSTPMSLLPSTDRSVALSISVAFCQEIVFLMVFLSLSLCVCCHIGSAEAELSRTIFGLDATDSDSRQRRRKRKIKCFADTLVGFIPTTEHQLVLWLERSHAGLSAS